MEGHRGWVAVLVGIVGLAIPASAGAAIALGETFTPDPGTTCSPRTRLQTTSPNGQYTAPTSGVITAWSFQGGASVSPLKLKVARPAGGDLFTIVGQDELRTPTANVLNTYQVRIPVQAGDVIGETNTADYKCQRAAPGYVYHSLVADPVVGSVEAFDPGGSGQLDLSARLEPDADNDGFGDETQDCDPADPSRAEDCAAPSATITSGPKNKTKKKRAKFEFTGTDTRAVASFECKLDSNLGFSPCTSPVTVKVKKGKHTFQVRAVDQAGNVGAPASDTWKRKRKKK